MVDQKFKLAIQLSLKEVELEELLKDIKKCEGYINSPKIPSGKHKNAKIKELEKLVKKRDELSTYITEQALLR